MRRFLVVTGVFEVLSGLGLAATPHLAAELLAAAGDFTDPAALLLARVGGLALIAIGIACLAAQHAEGGAGLRGLLTGLLFYNVTALVLLTHAALTLATPGPVLWPAVAAHALLSVWNGSILVRAARQ